MSFRLKDGVCQLDETERYLKAIWPTAGCLGMRVPKSWFDHKSKKIVKGGGTYEGHFDSPQKLISEARRIGEVNSFIGINPAIDGFMSSGTANRLMPVGPKEGTNDEQILCRNNWFLDVDAKTKERPTDASATNDERKAAIDVGLRLLDECGLTAHAIWGSSGNGFWSLVKLPGLPNDKATHDFIIKCHSILRRRYNIPGSVDIDTTVNNASRIAPLPGTVKAKGIHDVDRGRIWRYVSMESPVDHVRKPIDLQAWFDEYDDHHDDKKTSKAVSFAAPVVPQSKCGPCDDFDRSILESAPFKAEVAEAYIDNDSPDSIQGQGNGSGSKGLMSAVFSLMRRCALDSQEVMPFLERWNLTKAIPPWSPQELLHAVENGAKEINTSDPDYGQLLRAEMGKMKRDKTWPKSPRADIPMGLPPEGGFIFDEEPAQAISNQAVGDHKLTERPFGKEKNPNRLALRFLAENYTRIEDGQFVSTLAYYMGEFSVWREGRYVVVNEKDFSIDVTALLIKDFQEQYDLDLEDYLDKLENKDTDKKTLKRPSLMNVGGDIIANTITNIKKYVSMKLIDYPQIPAWIGAPSQEPVANYIVSRSGMLDINELLQDRFTLRPLTAEFFNRAVLDFDLVEHPGEPTEWLKFLNFTFPDDPNAILCLQEYMGYCLTEDVRFQQMLIMIGQSGGGKGTVLNMIRQIVGDSQFSPMAVQQYENRFSLATLADKLVAADMDVRFSTKDNVALILRNLLTMVSGEPILCDRKGLPMVQMVLKCKFILTANIYPNFGDTGKALGRRSLVLKFENMPKEVDNNLFEGKLKPEAPAVFGWAIEGLKRLYRNGKFTRSDQGETLREESGETTPLDDFAKACLVVDRTHTESKEDLHKAYENYCRFHDIKGKTYSVFFKDLQPIFPAMRATRTGSDKVGRTQAVSGIRIVTQTYRPDPKSWLIGLLAHGPLHRDKVLSSAEWFGVRQEDLRMIVTTEGLNLDYQADIWTLPAIAKDGPTPGAALTWADAASQIDPTLPTPF